MPSAATLRQQIEAALASRIPSALTPVPRVLCPTAPTGIPALDDALNGGLPIGVITELTGPECSGRTSLALSFLACLTNDNRVCAWVDVSDTLHPESAAASGVDLARLLWVRCGPEAEQLTLPGFAENITNESLSSRPKRSGAEGPAFHKTLSSEPCALSSAKISALPIRHDSLAPRCAEPVPKVRHQNREVLSSRPPNPSSAIRALRPAFFAAKRPLAVRQYSRLDQALRATDLLLQGGGFSAIVLDMGSVAPEFALRIPLATWFRYRAAAERTQASVLLLTQQACSKSSAGLVLHCRPSRIDPDSTTVLTGAEHRIEIARDRFARNSSLVEFDRRMPPQSDYSLLWQTRTPWSTTYPIHSAKAGRR